MKKQMKKTQEKKQVKKTPTIRKNIEQPKMITDPKLLKPGFGKPVYPKLPRKLKRHGTFVSPVVAEKIAPAK